MIKKQTNIRKRAVTLVLAVAIAIGGATIGLVPARAYAAEPTTNCDPALPADACVGGVQCANSNCGIIDKYIMPIVNVLAGVAGLVATISIVVGGIQYASSADDPQKVSAAKSRIYNALLGLLGFLFLWAFLQWLIPGGVLN